MDFSLSSEHGILRESIRSFAENDIQPVARELDEKEEFSYETMHKMAEMGLFGVFVSEKYGGQAMDYLSYIIAVEEIARVDGSHAATVAAENSLGIGPLYYFGSEDQKKNICPSSARARPSGASVSPNPTPVRMPPTSRPRRCWTETSGSSTAANFSSPTRPPRSPAG